MVGGLARRIFARQGHPGRIVTTSDLDAGVADADAVLLQLRVGGQAARHADETLAAGVRLRRPGDHRRRRAREGAAHRAGGPGHRRAGARGPHPDAWIVDFTNPVGIVTRALLDAGHRAVGLCNVAIGLQRRSPRCWASPPDAGPAGPRRPQPPHLGAGVRLGGPDGEDVLPRLLAEHGDALAERPAAAPRRCWTGSASCRPTTCATSTSTTRSCAELRSRPSRAAGGRRASRAELLEMYADPSLDEKPELLARRGGAFYSEAAVALLALLLGTGPGRGDAADVQVVNTLQRRHAAVPARRRGDRGPRAVGPTGAEPLPVAPLEPLYAGLVGHVTAYEDLALDAALRGGRDRVFTALLAHPLVGRYDAGGPAHRPAARAQPGFRMGVRRSRAAPRAARARPGPRRSTRATARPTWHWSAADGRVLARGARRRLPAPVVGIEAAVDVLAGPVRAVARRGRRPGRAGPAGGACLRLPRQRRSPGRGARPGGGRARAGLGAARWPSRNDTFALLRAGRRRAAGRRRGLRGGHQLRGPAAGRPHRALPGPRPDLR